MSLNETLMDCGGAVVSAFYEAAISIRTTGQRQKKTNKQKTKNKIIDGPPTMMTTVGSVLIPTVPPPCFGLKLHLHFDRRCVCVDLHATVRVLFFSIIFLLLLNSALYSLVVAFVTLVNPSKTQKFRDDTALK